MATALADPGASLWAPLFAKGVVPLNLYLQVGSGGDPFYPGNDLREVLFLAARRWEPMEEAELMTDSLILIQFFELSGIFSVEDMRAFLHDAADVSSLGLGLQHGRVLNSIKEARGGRMEMEFNPGEWVGPDGEQLNLQWRGAINYKKVSHGESRLHGEADEHDLESQLGGIEVAKKLKKYGRFTA
ncbi:hypothetical protein R1sor_024636 [Riccia sorocarpa]|uniref:Uncharacterized protein n=1 Tax=Riccia sorocarpa TaxID=122646 RepID=A0ABD3GU83_9MARC